MIRGAVARRYAQALFELAAGRDLLTQVENELQQVVTVVAGSAELANILSHPQVPAQVKKQTMDKLFEGKISGITLSFVELLVDRRRQDHLQEIMEEYVALANQVQNVADAQVTTAIELTSEEQQEFDRKLAQLTGKKVRLTTKVDPAIIGGVVVQIGDKVIDDSLATKLNTLKNSLLSIQLKEIGVNG